MKRKLATLLLALACLFGLAGLTACDTADDTQSDIGSSLVSTEESSTSTADSESPKNNSSEEGNSSSEDSSEVHTHSYTIAKKDDTHHWTECECGATATKVEHMYMMQKDGTHHWTECACGTTTAKVEHSYAGGECICGSKETEGLEYELSSDNTYYIVTGIGTATDTDIVIPSVYNEKPVQELGASAFSGCTHLTSMRIPDSVQTIREGAFSGCTTIIQHEDSVSYVDRWIVGCAPSSGDVSLRVDTKGIGDSAFDYCWWLPNITIPDSVQFIGDNAFYECTIASVVIGNGVESIGSAAFSHCENLESVVIGDNVQSIGNFAFDYCENLTSVTIGNGVQSIGKSAFHDCCKLMNVSMGNDVRSIGESAFRDCTDLQSIELPNSVQTIGRDAFYYCDNLTSVYISDIAAWCAIDFENADSNPLYYAKNLYVNNVLVTELVISDGVETIGYLAFCNYSNVTSVTIEGNVQSIEYGAFLGCTNLRNVAIRNNVQSIGNSSFWECTNLTSVDIGNSVKSIGTEVFYNCTKLTSITVAETNEHYASQDGNLYNKNKTKLIQYAIGKTESTFIIPDSVQSIGDRAFEACTNLTSIIIGKGIQSIGNYAFYGCTNVTSVIIGSDVQSIGRSAFNECTKVTSVYYQGTFTEQIEISIEDTLFYLIRPTWYYYSETEPVGEGNYWRYVNGVPTPWA